MIFSDKSLFLFVRLKFYNHCALACCKQDKICKSNELFSWPKGIIPIAERIGINESIRRMFVLKINKCLDRYILCLMRDYSFEILALQQSAPDSFCQDYSLRSWEKFFCLLFSSEKSKSLPGIKIYKLPVQILKSWLKIWLLLSINRNNSIPKKELWNYLCIKLPV